MRRVGKALKAVPGVTVASVSLATEAAAVNWLEGAAPPADIAAAARAGSPVPAE